jgi:hypothetical protein
MWYTTYDPPDHGGYGYETPSQFLFRPQPIEMTHARVTPEPYVDPKNLMTQLTTILRVFWNITQGQGSISKTLP